MIDWLLSHGLEVLIVSMMVTMFLAGCVVVLLWIVMMFVSSRIVAKEVETPVTTEARILTMAGSR